MSDGLGVITFLFHTLKVIPNCQIKSKLIHLKTAIKLNDPLEIGLVLDSIENHAFQFRAKSYQTFIFLILQIFDFRLNVAFDTKQFKPIAEASSLFDIKINDLELFTDNEIEGIGLRIEINKGLVFLLAEKFEPAYKLFSAIPILEGTSAEIRFYVKLFELISYCPLTPDKFQFKVYEKGLDYLENIKFKGTTYSKSFLKLLLENKDRKNLTKFSKEFSEKNIPVSTFDKALQHWIYLLQPNRR